MTTPGAEILIDGKPYNIVLDTSGNAYEVTDVPAHPDSDSRMERKVIWNSFTKGIQSRSDTKSLDASQYSGSGNPFTRISRAVEGFRWTNGLSTYLGDRILPQRALAGSQTPASAPLFMGDTSIGSYIVCKSHVYYLNGTSGGVQQLLLTLGGGTGTTFTTTQIVDACSYNGKLYLAHCTLTNGNPDFTQPQPMWCHDETTTTTVWSNPPTNLANVTGITVTNAGTAGSTRYDYTVIALSGSSNSVDVPSITNITGNTTLNSTNYNTISWSAVGGATSYVVYRTFSGGTPASIGPIATVTGATTYNDQGANIISTPNVFTPGYVAGDNGSASAFVVIRGILYRATGAKLYAWDGTARTWDSGTLVGDPKTAITGLDVYKDGLVVFKQEGLYTVQTNGQVLNLFPGFRVLGYNPRPLCQWRGDYYFATDGGGIFQWQGTTVKSIGFSQVEPYPMLEIPSGGGAAANTLGIPNAVTRGMGLAELMVVGFNRWLSTNNAAFILAWDGDGWHPYRYVSGYQCSGLGTTGGNQNPSTPILQVGLTRASGAPTQSLQWLNNPIIDPFLATDLDTSAQEMWLNIDQGVIEDEFKVLEGIMVVADYPQNGTINVAYAIDSDLTVFNKMVDCGAPLPPTGNTMAQAWIPPGNLPSYRRIGLRITVTPLSAALTPVIRTVIMRYKQREPQRQVWELLLFIEEGQRTSFGGLDNRPSRDVLLDLKALRRDKKLVDFNDIFGDTYKVYVEQVGEKLHTFKNNQFGSWVAKVRLVETGQIIGTP